MDASFEVEQFLMSNEVDEKAAAALRDCTPEVQTAAMARGSLADAKNPSAALMFRIKEAKGGGKGGGKANWGGGGGDVDPIQVGVEVEAFIASNELDESLAETFRSCAPDVQQRVLLRGDLSSARNKSAVLQTRIKEASAGSFAGGGGGAGWGVGGGGAGCGWAGPGSAGWSCGGGDGWGCGGKGAMGKGWGMSGGKGGWDDWSGGMMGMMGMMGGMFGGFGGGKSYAVHPDVLWIAAESKLTAEGFGGEAPVLVYEKSQEVFQSASNLLAELVGDVPVNIVHDADWTEFPEIGEAIKQVSREEHCFAVARCDQHGMWGVGCAAGWKGRESSAKLALCVALAAGTPAFNNRVARNYPEFSQMCMASGLAPMGGGKGCGGGCGGSWVGGGKGEMDMPMGGGMMYNPEMPAQPSMGAAVTSAPPIHWVALPPDSTLVMQGFPFEGPAIAHDKSYADSFRNSHHILADLVPDVNELVFQHDPEWSKFPEIAEALKGTGAEENCFCVVTCPSMSKWAIGLGSGWKGRESAGKLAMALSLAMGSEALPKVANNYPEFGVLCASAGMGDMPGPPQKKSRKGY